MSASLSSALTRVARQIADVTATGTPVIAGGAAFDEDGVRASRLGASAYADSPEEARAVLKRLPDVVIPPPVPWDPEAVRLSAMTDTMAREVLAATERRLDGGSDELPPDHWRVVLGDVHAPPGGLGRRWCHDRRPVRTGARAAGWTR